MQECLASTPVGDARLLVDEAAEPLATLVLGHGAGGGIRARDLVALADELPAAGVTVVRVEQPWLVAGRKVAPAPAVLDRGWRGAVNAIQADGPLVVGGRSAGARVACRTASQLGAAGVVCLAFPLHPPGKPERSRLAELTGSSVPTLVVQGERDSFGRPAEFPAGPSDLVTVSYADHGMAVPKAQDQSVALETVVRSVREWLGNAPGIALR